MVTTNVIEFAPALQRRRELQVDHTGYAGRYGTWPSRYREGIDGLWTDRQVSRSAGEVVPFLMPRKRLAAEG